MKKYKAETTVYAVATALTIAGAGLSLAGILIPYWYEVNVIQGIAQVEAEIGIWQDRICIAGIGCENHWINEDSYDRLDAFKMPKEDLIKWFETIGCALSFFTILLLIPLWATHIMGSNKMFKVSAYSVFFTSVMLSGFLNEVGVLILASEVDTDDTGFAPFFNGAAGALLMIAGCMACAVCRYDPSYGTLENPVSPTFIQA